MLIHPVFLFIKRYIEMSNKIVKFIKSNSPYHKDDVAGFPEAVADRLIKAKKAVDYSKEAAAELKRRAEK